VLNSLSCTSLVVNGCLGWGQGWGQIFMCRCHCQSDALGRVKDESGAPAERACEELRIMRATLISFTSFVAVMCDHGDYMDSSLRSACLRGEASR
jgi:hypothetical protein